MTIPSKKLIAESFSRRAASYDDHASVQRRAVERLADYASAIKGGAGRPWIDLGCGTGLFARLLRPPARSIVCIDIAAGCVTQLSRLGLPGVTCAVGDAELPPVKNGAFDLAVLSSVLQWLPSPLVAVRQARVLLAHGGVLLFSVFLHGTLAELVALRARHGLDESASYVHRVQFLALLEAEGFAVESTDRIFETCYYPSPLTAIKSLVRTGAAVAGGSGMSAAGLFEFCREYDQRFRTEQGVPVTYDVLTGVARKVD